MEKIEGLKKNRMKEEKIRTGINFLMSKDFGSPDIPGSSCLQWLYFPH